MIIAKWYMIDPIINAHTKLTSFIWLSDSSCLECMVSELIEKPKALYKTLIDMPTAPRMSSRNGEKLKSSLKLLDIVDIQWRISD